MLPDFLVGAILQDLLDPEARGLDPKFLSKAVADMKGRVARMPRYMGTGMTALTLLFGAGGYPAWPRERRLRFLARWRHAPVSVFRDFVEFYEKMGTFVYYTHVEHAQS